MAGCLNEFGLVSRSFKLETRRFGLVFGVKGDLTVPGHQHTTAGRGGGKRPTEKYMCLWAYSERGLKFALKAWRFCAAPWLVTVAESENKPP